MKKEQEPEQIRYPAHLSGKRCGYRLHEDGSIEVAPMYTDAMNRALDEELALQELIETFIRQAHKLRVPITASQRSFWESVFDDYGLEPGSHWTYNRRTGRIIPIPKEEVDDDGTV